MKRTFLAISLACVSALAAHAAPATERSGLLADNKGMTLYVFKKDAANQSTCYDNCAKAWPPFFVADPTKADADFVVVQRKDGTKQWAYKGQPLYYYAGDGAPGEATGEGSGGVWYVVKSGNAPAVKPTTGGY
jgi:predicted lipoprotein with Yx(FWY)xxD motif